MSATAVREVLLRALFDPAFHSKLISSPSEALREYDLTDVERGALLAPTSQLYALVDPRNDPGLSLGPDDTRTTRPPSPPAPSPPPTTTTTTTVVVAVIAVVSIIAFTAAAAPSTSQKNARKNLRYRLEPLLTAIRKSSGAERYDLIRTLLTELTKNK